MDKKPPKQPRKITPQYLENAALFYLQRFSTSAGNFRTVMRRKIDRSCRFHKVEPDAFYSIVDAMVERYIAVGLLDDKVYARAKTTTLRRQGKSKQAITAKLKTKGLGAQDIGNAFDEVDTADDAELTAALHLARKKKLGKHRTKPLLDPIKDRQKEMAALARAGFSFDIAKRVLDYDGDSDD